MNWTMETVYLGCAAAGGTVLVLQTGMALFGGGDHDAGHADVSHDIGHADSGETHGHDPAFSLLSVRTCAAFLTFFGLVGFGGTSAGWGTYPTMAAALAAGTVMLLAVAWLFSLQRKLYSEGNVDPRNAVGHTARVYLKIPGANAGKGKITVALQGRTVEYNAATAGRELATGSEVRVVRLITPDTFEVEPLS
ncbi:MAG: hypothetical protein ACKVWV_02250 [Planctomycetota bacterium]